MHSFSKKLKILALTVFAFGLLVPVLPVGYVEAQSEGVVPLSALPGTTDQSTGRATLQTYVPGLFKLLLGFSAVLAVVMIIIGGLQWMLADSVTNKSEGRKRIGEALGGLLLLLASFLILRQISPNLVNFNLDITDVDATKGGFDKKVTDASGEFTCPLDGKFYTDGTACTTACTDGRSKFACVEGKPDVNIEFCFFPSDRSCLLMKPIIPGRTIPCFNSMEKCLACRDGSGTPCS